MEIFLINNLKSLMQHKFYSSFYTLNDNENGDIYV